MGNHPPHTFQPGLASSPMHPLMSTPYSIWLLFILIKRRSSKAKAPPPSLLFNAFYFASPSKQTNDSKCDPDSPQPEHGVGEQRQFGGATALPIEWEGAKPLEGRVAWLILLVVVSPCVCYVLCFVLQPTTRRLYLLSPVVFFSSFVIIGVGILTQQTVIWVFFQPLARQLYLLFFRVVIFSSCNLNPPKNMAGQTTVFFLVVFFLVVCKYHDWSTGCLLCQNTNTTNHTLI